MKIFIKTLSGSLVHFTVEPSDTMMQLKLSVQETQGSSVKQQELFWNGKQLADNKTFAFYHMPEEAKINLVLKTHYEDL